MTARRAWGAVLVLVSCALFGVAALGAYGVTQGQIGGLFPWQSKRLYRLLLVAVVWFLAVAGLALVAVVTGRRSSPTSIRWPGVRSWVPAASLVALMAAFVAAYGWLSITRHQRFNSTGYDLAINEQIVWNTLHGRFFASSIEVDNSFADHFRPFLAVALPFYALFPSPVTLLVLQTVGLSAAAVPLYCLAKHKLSSPAIALGVAAAYLASPSVGFVARFDFHVEALSIPAFIAAFYALERNHQRWASFWLVIPLLCKENMGLTVAAFGLYALLARREVGFGVVWIGIGLLTFWAASFWLIPTVRGASPDTLSRYLWLGESPLQMLAAPVSRPAEVWRHVMDPKRLLYLLQLLVPVGFLALVGLPELLPAVPGLALNLLAQHHCQATIYCQYAVPLIPFLFVATIFGLSRLRTAAASRDASPWTWRLLGLGLIPLAAAALWTDNPFTENQAVPSALARVVNAEVVELALQVTPAAGSLVTTNDYAPHLAQRRELYIIGIPTQRKAPTNPDIVFLNLYDQDYIVCDQYREYVAQLDIERYGVVFRTGGLIVIQRTGGSNDEFRDFILNWNDCAG